MSDNVSATIVLLGSIVPILGVLLLIRGLRGRRVGEEPRCRKCKYNLTGTESQRCPECGHELTPENLMFGLRHRRRVSMAFGSLLLIVTVTAAGLYVYGQANNVDWYRYYPAGALLAAADLDKSGALDELLRRHTAGGLSAANLRAVAAVALDKHAQDPAPSRFVDWCDLLAKLDGQDLLTDRQRDRFYSQLIPMRLEARPVIRQGDPLVWGVACKDRTSQHLPFRYYATSTEVRVGGRRLDADGWRRTHAQELSFYRNIGRQDREEYYLSEEYPPRYGFPDLSSGFPDIVTFDVGRQLVELEVTQQWSHEDQVPDIQTPVRSTEFIWSKEFTLTAEVEVLPADAPDPVKWIDDPGVEASLRSKKSYTPDVFTTERSWESEDHFRVEMDFRRLFSRGHFDRRSLALAFDMIAKVGDQEFDAGYLIERPGGGRMISYHDFPVAEETELTLILRSSRDVARRTIDIDRIWHGEIEIGPIPIKRERRDDDRSAVKKKRERERLKRKKRKRLDPILYPDERRPRIPPERMGRPSLEPAPVPP